MRGGKGWTVRRVSPQIARHRHAGNTVVVKTEIRLPAAHIHSKFYLYNVLPHRVAAVGDVLALVSQLSSRCDAPGVTADAGGTFLQLS